MVRVLAELSNMDINIWFSMVIICGIVYLLGGILILKNKNTKLISKRDYYFNIDKLCTVYGLNEVIVSISIMVIAIFGMIFKQLYWYFFLAALLFIIYMLIFQLTYPKKYLIKK